jgi:secreted trypsin-like serine protease
MTFRAAWALAALAAVGCGGFSDENAVVEDDSAIIGGRPDARTTAAVGALVQQFNLVNGPGYQAFCTATLIAPKVVIAAEHCMEKANGKWGFAMGEYGTTDIATGHGPTRVVLADRFEVESTVTGATQLGLGSDVALVYLREAIDDVEPVAVGTLSDADVGKTFTAIGYGLQRDLVKSGERRSGTERLAALRGPILPPLVKFAEYDRRSGGDSAENRAYYDSASLLEGYETVVAPGTAPPCSGDSGGPLFAKRNGRPTIFGVASYVVGTADEACAFGTVYATFGRAAKTMIDRALRAR